MSDDIKREIKDLVSVVHELTVTVEKSITNQESQRKDVERIEGTVSRLHDRVDTVEQNQAANGVRLKIAGIIGVAVLTGTIGLFFAVIKPVISANVSNKEVTSRSKPK
jgi:hypothetical protein